MENVKGFTLIELLIVIFAITTVFFVAFSGIGNNVSFGLTGIAETRCIGGYQFLITDSGRSSRQIMDDNGHGVKCK